MKNEKCIISLGETELLLLPYNSYLLLFNAWETHVQYFSIGAKQRPGYYVIVVSKINVIDIGSQTALALISTSLVYEVTRSADDAGDGGGAQVGGRGGGLCDGGPVDHKPRTTGSGIYFKIFFVFSIFPIQRVSVNERC